MPFFDDLMCACEDDACTSEATLMDKFDVREVHQVIGRKFIWRFYQRVTVDRFYRAAVCNHAEIKDQRLVRIDGISAPQPDDVMAFDYGSVLHHGGSGEYVGARVVVTLAGAVEGQPVIATLN